MVLNNIQVNPGISKIQLRSESLERWLQRSPPSVLCHYTDQSGLRGIIASGELWATKVQYMNDTTEFKLAIDVAETVLKTKFGDSSAETFDLARSILSRLRGISHANICTVSFCENPDLLSQWRGYSGKTAGYSIGLRADALLSVAKEQGCQLGACIYSNRDQNIIVQELIDDLVQNFVDLRRVQDLHTACLHLRNCFQMSLVKCGAFFKDESFKEENEWRIVTSLKGYNDDEFDFREGTSMLVPYCKVPIRGDSWEGKISSVVVGPCPHPEEAKKAVEGLLIKYSAESEDRGSSGSVTPSKIPYRHW